MKNYTAHEVIDVWDNISTEGLSGFSDSDDDDNNLDAFIVLEPPEERPDAHTDEDSDHEDTGNPDQLPRRILNAKAELRGPSKRLLRRIGCSAITSSAGLCGRCRVIWCESG